MTTSTISQVFTVSQVDVLYVTQQMGRDLNSLSQAYPEYLKPNEVFQYQDSLTTFIINDAIDRVGFSILSVSAPYTVYHELRYQVGYGSFSSRAGVGDRACLANGYRLSRSSVHG